MRFGLQWVVDKLTFPSPPSSYSLTSHPELFFVKSPRSQQGFPGVPCMLYAIPQGAPILVVHAHSNGCDIGDMRQTLQNISESLKVHVMSFEFPGYGLHLGTASMRSIDEAAIAVANFIANDLKVDSAQVIWYGRSIGSGPALRMAHRATKELKGQTGGVVIQCGFANFPEVAGHLFGRVAKQLVSPLWPNEALMKELRCPVLLIHGRNDTMIPIAQSQKLWDAVKEKELSNFHTCDCGHNDFNFRRCTLRPIYEFLVKVIAAPGFPSCNLKLEVPAASKTYVHHIGPLRSKIPVYSFRRPELEEYLQRLLMKRQATLAAPGLSDVAGQPSSESRSDPAQPPPKANERASIAGLGPEDGMQMNGLQGTVQAFDEQSDRWWLMLDTGESVLLRARNLVPCTDTGSGGGGANEAAAASETSADTKATSTTKDAKNGALKAKTREVKAASSTVAVRSAPVRRNSNSSVGSNVVMKIPATLPPEMATSSTSATAKAKKVKRDAQPAPDFTDMAPEEDAARALLDPEGMVKTCAMRVSAFLERVQSQLDRVDALESKPIDEVVALVESEFWACDPLLGLWEEVSVADGDRVRFRLGPFSVDNYGQRTYDPGLGTGRTQAPAAFIRQPMWLFSPSSAHFRCLAEWSLLQSTRLVRNLPSRPGASNSSCCASFRRGSRKPARGRAGTDGGHPSRGALATSFAAHFVHWVDKKMDIKAIFRRFVDLYENPESCLRRPDQAAAAGRGSPAPLLLAPKELTSDMPPTTPGSGCEDNSEAAAEELPASNRLGARPLHKFAHKPSSVDVLSPARGGQKPFFPCLGPAFSSSARALFRDGQGACLDSAQVDLEAKVWGTGGRKGSLVDFQSAGEMIADAIAFEEHLDAQLQRRHLDWTSAGLLLHYERLLWGAAPNGSIAPGAAEEGWGDPLRPDLRRATSALNSVVKAFLQAEHRERQLIGNGITAR